jgi:hypothetical protein
MTADKVVLSLDISYHALMEARQQLTDREWVELAHYLRSETERILTLPEEPEPIIDATCVDDDMPELPPPVRKLPSGHGGRAQAPG